MRINNKEYKEKDNIRELAKEYSFFKFFNAFGKKRDILQLHVYPEKSTGYTWIGFILLRTFGYYKEISISPFWSFTYERCKAQRSYQ